MFLFANEYNVNMHNQLITPDTHRKKNYCGRDKQGVSEKKFSFLNLLQSTFILAMPNADTTNCIVNSET